MNVGDGAVLGWQATPLASIAPWSARRYGLAQGAVKSPEGALEDSPGREPGVSSDHCPLKPRRGERGMALSPLRGLGPLRRPHTEGSRPGLFSYVPAGLPETAGRLINDAARRPKVV